MGSLAFGMRDASGLHYRRNRFYDAEQGRFTQEDPIGLAGGINLYGYANGDPVTYSDPYGLNPCEQSSAWTDCLALALANWGGRNRNSVAMYAGATLSAVFEATGINALASAGDHIGNGRVLRGSAEAGIMVAGGAAAQRLGGAVSRALSHQRVRGLVTRFVGNDARAFLNDAGDLVIQSSDELREVRFDINRPHPHQSPHVHVVEYKRVKNRKVEVRNDRVYPSDVPHQ
jgi:RHS repeat-associated protein